MGQRKTRPDDLQQTLRPIELIEHFGGNDDPKVLLLVGHDDMNDGSCQFLVSEHSVRALGPRLKATVLNRTLREPWLPKWLFKKSPVTINLWDEEVNVIRIMMQIVNHQFRKLPLALDWTDIVNLTGFAARYDCHTLLGPHIDGWVTPYKERLCEVGYEEWLLVAYQFGYETEYLEVAKYLATNARANDAGTAILTPGFPFELKGNFPIDALGVFANQSLCSPRKRLRICETHVPPTTSPRDELTPTEHINEGRRQLIHEMLRSTYDY